MSYILDALRKADAQRERDPARGIHAQPMRGAIGERRLRDGNGSGVWAAAAGAMVILALGGWYFYSDRGTAPAATTDVAVNAPGPAVEANAAPVVAPPPPPAAAVLPPPVVVPPPIATAPRVVTSPATTPPPVVVPALPAIPAAAPSVEPPSIPTAGMAPSPGAQSTGASPVTASPDAAPAVAAPVATDPPLAGDSEAGQVPRSSRRRRGAPAAVPGQPPPVAVPGQATPAPVPAAAAPSPVAEPVVGLPADAPRLVISGGVYSGNVAQRMLIVNGQVFNQGSEVGAGVVLEEIRPKGAVLRYRGSRYSVTY